MRIHQQQSPLHQVVQDMEMQWKHAVDQHPSTGRGDEKMPQQASGQ